MASTQIPPSTPTLWNVFLSFRGIDTRLSFTSYLYDALQRNGVRTFMDDPELYNGDIISAALLDAIRNSKIYIIVLSENYASSSWCLDELVEILKCFKELGRSLIPVFYKIDPSDVRYQTKSFETAFEKHEKVHLVGTDKLNRWRLTLSQVSGFSGHHVGETRSEVEIINEIVDVVLREINPMTIDIAKYPVGIDSRVADITPLLTSGTQGVQYIGIWGMGGVGKTTLAKAVYNANFRSFEGSCFLANVREVSGQPNGIQGLQAQLVADVLKVNKSAINSIDQGIQLIRQRICSKKILIVVDDLNDPKQLDALVVGPFACGSVILLTTRHEDLLATVGVEARYRYMLNVLGDAQSRQLFNKHAFGDVNPSHTFLVLSKEVLHHAGGLPLALQVFGTNLRNQSEAEWRRFIGQLKEVGNPDIQKNLVISFESLVDSTLKEIFLDIACFFVGRDREDVVVILKSFYRDVEPNIDRLKTRSLITFDEYNRISMHDLLGDMGRHIARRNFPIDEPEKHSRLSDWADIYNVLDDNTGTEAITGMVHRINRSNDQPYKATFDTETFKRMPKLRFLKMNHVNLTGSFEQIFKDLRWLQWEQCPLKSLPSDFCPKKLVILELRGSKIRMWEQTRDLKTLKILDLSSSEELITTPDFSRLLCLETIKLNRCTKLEKVDTTIGSLVNLVTLDLEYCTSLRSLPDSVCNLRALKSLNIGGCHKLGALPEELGKMISLINLKVNSLTISKLPDSIGHLTKLVKLILNSNTSLETLPVTICSMSSLEVLDISHCRGLDSSQLPNLGLPLNLLQLYACHCMSMLTSPDLSNLKSLKVLDLTACYHLNEIRGLEELTSIASLNLVCCSSMKRLPNLSNFKQLETLSLSCCSSLREIEGLEKLISIRKLDLDGCNSFMLANTLTESLFQKLSEFGHTIEIQVCREDVPNWISHPRWRSKQELINLSHKFSGLLLSVDCFGNDGEKLSTIHECTYIIKNRATGLSYSINTAFRAEFYQEDDESADRVMVIVPIKKLIQACGGFDEDTLFAVSTYCRTHYHDSQGILCRLHPLQRHASSLKRKGGERETDHFGTSK